MKFNRYLSFAFLLGLLLFQAAASQTASRTLDIYFIDVEGGAATLIVTPAGESLLVDSGFPGERDAGRIAHVALEVAGLKQIDHYLTTHWHRDHVGGSARLAQLIPIRNYYDHGLPQTITPDILPELHAAAAGARADRRRNCAGREARRGPGSAVWLGLSAES